MKTGKGKGAVKKDKKEVLKPVDDRFECFLFGFHMLFMSLNASNALTCVYVVVGWEY